MMRKQVFATFLSAFLLTAGQAFAQADDSPAAAAQPAPETVISSIEEAGDKAAEINEMGTVGGVDLVVVDTLSGDEASRAIENAVSLNEYDVRNLQSALEKKPEVSAKLQNDGVEVRNIVAADVENDRVVLYVRKQ